MKKVFIFLLIAFLFKQLVWLGLIPIWHFPDEEQHFAHVAFFADKGFSPRKGADFDVSQEIDLSSELLGTKRDGRGINKFTYHPEYRIPYPKSETGLYEEEIQALNNQENRQTMVKREAARYGPIYYWLTVRAYKLFDNFDLFTRVFSSRFPSIILSSLTVVLVYCIAQEIFKTKILRLSLVSLVAFQPMFSFVSAGVNSDNFFNLIFTALLYLCLKVFFAKKANIFSKDKILYWLLLGLVLTAGFYTKLQIIISLPIIFLAFLFSFVLVKSKKKRKQYLALMLLVLILGFLGIKKFGRIPEYDSQVPSKLAESFFQYIFWHLRHTVTETIPWYWGVFNWLGVTLPRWVNQVQARILIISALGLLVYLIKVIKEKRFFKRNNLKIIFLFGSAAIYYLAIISWDYFFRTGHGFSFGIQGRYFFPTIVVHMLMILLGVVSLIPKKFKAIGLKILISWWFSLSLIGLHTAVKSYYQLWPLETFLNQASQYKPLVFKTIGLSTIILLFFISSFIFMVSFLRRNEK